MNTTELNEYIENYLVKDKSHRAIMMTAPWGTGKTYYIKNDLRKYFEDKDLGYVYVSLYGIKDLKELNKQLFMEINAKNFAKNTTGKSVLKIVGKTIIKGVASFFGVNLDQSPEDWQKLYDSVNLENKLIIFDDIERSQIDLIEFMGYVNNLVEDDGIKVLMVTNHEELLQYEQKDKDNKDYTEDTKKYIKIKEKTVGDTINFNSNTYETIDNIYNSFENQKFYDIEKKVKHKVFNIISLIESLMRELNCFNYRSLIYGLQKTSDIFDKLSSNEYDLSFLENVLLGTVAFSLRYSYYEKPVWKKISITSNELGCLRYPLFKFMFDYITYQSFNERDVEIAEEMFIKSQKYAEQDINLSTLYSFYIRPENEVLCAIKNIHDALKKNEGISESEYIKLSNYLIVIKDIIGEEKLIDECKKLMLDNLREKANIGAMIEFVNDGMPLSDDDLKDEFDKFRGDAHKIVEGGYNYFSPYEYDTENIEEWSKSIRNTRNEKFVQYGFAKNINIASMLNMLEHCNSKDIYEIRDAFSNVYYKYSNAKSLFQGDIPNLSILQNEVDELINSGRILDKIQLQQLKWFSNDLNTILERIQ